MRIGFYGGTINPIHRGHLTAARAAMDARGRDRLLLIPASVPPHKALPQGSADAADRLEMAALASAQLGPVAQALDIELHRTGPSYTVDTLRQLLSQSIPQLVSSVITIVSVFFSMCMLSWQLTIVTMLMVALMLFCS